MIKQALDLKVGDTVVGGTGTAVVEAVEDFGDHKVVTYADDRTMRYIDSRVTYSQEMNPLLRVDNGR